VRGVAPGCDQVRNRAQRQAFEVMAAEQPFAPELALEGLQGMICRHVHITKSRHD
jgi:hypothetical protein